MFWLDGYDDFRLWPAAWRFCGGQIVELIAAGADVGVDWGGLQAGAGPANLRPCAAVWRSGDGLCYAASDVVALPWIVVAQREDGVAQHTPRETFQVASAAQELFRIGLGTGKVLPAAWRAALDHAVDAIFGDGKFQRRERQSGQYLMFQATPIPILKRMKNVRHPVLVQGDNMPGLFSHRQCGISLFPDCHALLFGQVRVADPEGEDRTQIGSGGGQLHAAHLEADKEREVFGRL